MDAPELGGPGGERPPHTLAQKLILKAPIHRSKAGDAPRGTRSSGVPVQLGSGLSLAESAPTPGSQPPHADRGAGGAWFPGHPAGALHTGHSPQGDLVGERTLPAGTPWSRFPCRGLALADSHCPRCPGEPARPLRAQGRSPWNGEAVRLELLVRLAHVSQPSRPCSLQTEKVSAQVGNRALALTSH